MNIISFDDFKKLDIKIGTVLEAEKIEGTDKLLKLRVDLGNEKRTLVAGIAETHQPEDLIGKQLPLIANLEPRTLKGIESQGMILAAVIDDKAILLYPENNVPPGTNVS